MKKIISLFAFLSFFLFPISVFADGSFTASAVSYNPTTHVLSFTFSGYGGGTPPNWVALDDYPGSDGDHIAYANSPSCISGSSGSCTVTLDQAGTATFPCDHNTIIRIYDGSVNYFSQILDSTISASCSPTPTAPAGFAVNPTDAANLNAAVGSIPTAAKSEVFSIFPVVMPYLLILIILGVAFFIVRKLMKQAEGGSDSSWVESSQGIRDHMLEEGEQP